ncbi:MAG: TIGR03936 family radical SAM-associated protein [Candidatus Cloacimonetes bacterium]|nr:TIGR03936 family radical SAM-associated protein [Candidatus Cloacimonadota bacterium]
MERLAIEPWLARVEKPARYIGHETHAWHKPISSDTVSICFAFPDVYEVGFSHLGLKLLYDIVNRSASAVADRVYAPWPDMAAILREQKLPLFGIESSLPLAEFDVVGFTLQSELTFTNVLDMLHLAHIPLRSADRTDSHPLVLGGGPAISNPLPLSPFFDAILIGEGEEAIIEIMEAVRQTKGKPRTERLQALAGIDGMFVPTLPSDTPVRCRKFTGFASSGHGLSSQLVPWLSATHDRYIIEVMRGCTRGCRFCHAGFFYRPSRERDAGAVLDHLWVEVARDGWEEAAFTSLSSSDYTPIRALMRESHRRLAGMRVNLSLPSLRVDTLDDEILELLGRVGKVGVTIAPEAGSQRLRDIINKNITEEEILRGVRLAVERGWQQIKLYFMIGLPFETDEDVAAIPELVWKILRTGGPRLRVHITVSPFVPKPFTPFQWVVMEPPQALIDKVNLLRNAMRRYRTVKLKYHGIESALLEAALGRGDERCGAWIEAAWRRGARFDGWDEHFDWQRWHEAAAEVGLDLQAAVAGFATDAPLPWDVVTLGIDKNYLVREWELAQAAVTSPDCKTAGCTGCGLCDDNIAPQTASAELPHGEMQAVEDDNPQERVFYRAWVSKDGLLRFVAHLDFMRRLQRALRATGLPLAYSKGFSPHPKVALSPPLPVGVEGEREYIDFALVRFVSASEVDAALRRSLPPEVRLLEVRLSRGSKEREMSSSSFEWVSVWPSPEFYDQFASDAAAFAAAVQWPFERTRKGKTRTSDLKQLVHRLDWDGAAFHIVKALAGASVYDVIEQVFGQQREDTGGWRIVRRGLYSSPSDIPGCTRS